MAGRFSGSSPVPKSTPMSKTTSTDVISRFDFLKLTSGAVSRMATSTDNLDFCGISLDDSANGDDAQIRVCRNDGYNTGVEFEYDLESAEAATVLENLAFGTLQNLVNTDTDPIMTCIRNNSGSSATTVKCVMKIKLKSNADYLGDAS